MKKLTILTCSMAIVASAQSFGAVVAGAGTTAYVDMGNADTTLSQGDVQSDGNHWSTVLGNGAVQGTDLVDSVTGASLPWRVEAYDFENDSTNTGSPTVFVPGADDGLWARSDKAAYFIISGLDSSGALLYDLSFYGSRSTGTAATTFQAVGVGTSSITQFNQGSIPTGVVSLSGVQADINGEIRVNLSLPTDDLYIVNAFSVQAVPEPSSAALLGLSALALIMRRKR